MDEQTRQNKTKRQRKEKFGAFGCLLVVYLPLFSLLTFNATFTLSGFFPGLPFWVCASIGGIVAVAMIAFCSSIYSDLMDVMIPLLIVGVLWLLLFPFCCEPEKIVGV